MGKNNTFLDLLITGVNPNGYHQLITLLNILDELNKKYECIEIYTLGSPQNGANSLITEYAFSHKQPLHLGCMEDIENMKQKLSKADHSMAILLKGDNADEEVIQNFNAALTVFDVVDEWKVIDYSAGKITRNK